MLRGTWWRNALTGRSGYWWAHPLGAQDFDVPAAEVGQRVKQASLAAPLASGRPIHYGHSGPQDQPPIALPMAAQHGIRPGPLCVLSAVELGRSYAVKRKCRHPAPPELALAPRKCLLLYHYFLPPVWGFMSVRLETWFPFPVHISPHRRQWLAPQMDGAGIRYRRHHNCFTWVENRERAPALPNQQWHTNWVPLCDAWVRQVHPWLSSERCGNYPMQYFWTCQDSEWAMDLLFRHREPLGRLVPRLLHWGVVALARPDRGRFMGKKVTRQGNAAAGLKLPASSDSKIRTRLATSRCIRRTDDPHSAWAGRAISQSTADRQHRAVVWQPAWDRYCCVLAAVDDTSTLEELTAVVERRVRWKGQSVPAFHPFHAEDYALRQAVYRGEFHLTGLSCACSALTGSFANAYHLSANGRIIIGAILSAHRMTVQQINALAA